MLDEIADRAWQHRLARSPYLQLRNGVQVTSLPKGTLDEAESDAGFAKGLLAELGEVDRE